MPNHPDSPCPRRHPSRRRLHLVDADNLAGSGCPPLSEIRRVHEAYRAAVRPGPLDHTIVACCHQRGVDVGLEWPGVQLLWRSGPDGADLVLLEALERTGDVAERFAGVVIGSGDGIFAPAARELSAAGLPVVVAFGVGSLARELGAVAAVALQILDPPGTRHLAA